MNARTLLYRAGSYLWHQISAWNTRGEGIHSPYLFYIVRMLLYDENAYYCFKDIEYRRECMLRAFKTLQVIDYGTGVSGEKKVSDIARKELESAKIGQLLFRLVLHLVHEQERPLQVLELGTSLGITTAYLAKADSRNMIITMEGGRDVLDMARLNHERLAIHNVRYIEGNIDDCLPALLKERMGDGDKQTFDFVYIDANHTYEATIRYFEQIRAWVHDKTIVAIDDIHHSEAMGRAWNTIQRRQDVTTTMDLYHVGLVFFDPHYIKRNYKLRI